MAWSLYIAGVRTEGQLVTVSAVCRDTLTLRRWLSAPQGAREDEVPRTAATLRRHALETSLLQAAVYHHLAEV